MEAEIITRELGATAKNSPLTNAEVDQNFINLKDEVEVAKAQASTDAIVFAIALG
jgi:hypothetical protein